MLLALDVGNTNVTIGVFKRKEIIEVFRITTKLPRTSDEFGILISNLLKEKGFRGEIKWQYFNVISRSSAEGKAAALSLQPLTVLLPG